MPRCRGRRRRDAARMRCRPTAARRPLRASSSTFSRSPGAKRTRPRARAWRSRASLQISSPSRCRRPAPGPWRAGRDGALTALEQDGDLSGVEDVERARLEPRAPQRADGGRRVVGLDDECRRGGGERVEPERHAGDQRQLPRRAAHELAEVVARDVLHDFPAGARDRAVAEHDGNARARGRAACRTGATAGPRAFRRCTRRSWGPREGRATTAGRPGAALLEGRTDAPRPRRCT